MMYSLLIPHDVFTTYDALTTHDVFATHDALTTHDVFAPFPQAKVLEFLSHC